MIQVLLALVPYTRQNLQLSFSPHRFFNELDRTSGHSRRALSAAYKRAQQRQLVTIRDDKSVQLSLRARQVVQPYVAEKLQNAHLMVIFDIPEQSSSIRRELRLVLVELKFQQVQKSVWTSQFDHKHILVETVAALGADKWVQIYEAVQIDT